MITKNGVPWLPVECKMSMTNPSANFSLFANILKLPFFLQLVDKPHYLEKKAIGGKTVWIWSAPQFFRYLP